MAGAERDISMHGEARATEERYFFSESFFILKTLLFQVSPDTL
jgi:hypothetical protein